MVGIISAQTEVLREQQSISAVGQQLKAGVFVLLRDVIQSPSHVILSPSLVILSKAKNLVFLLRINSAKNLALFV